MIWPMHAPGMARRLAAELIGTFWLVFAGCGAAEGKAMGMQEVPMPMGAEQMGPME